ncbi:hypothetical protein NM688_g5032 [Phlebia brevispora]|uniref:Uncharacterized protein n=1 Tax=Phlebia brevispora TaxID=194682 RepID=A0ACC1T171_9APHY|nr:hypothetical protein NM688_g5032 [Phlebia brevispora]
MGKKNSLKSALSSQQSRLKKKQEAKQAAEVEQKNKKPGNTARNASKGKAKATHTAPAVIPFKVTDRILLIGEGNFSFTHALVVDAPAALQYFPPANITATAYDSEEECFSKYPEAQDIVQVLREKSVEILFGVDATKLEKNAALRTRRFDRILWNFPHAGKGIADQDRNILSNQVLLLDFLRSAAHMLKTGPVPSVQGSRRRKANSESDDEGPPGSSDEEGKQTIPSRGTVLITLRNVPPYTLWDLPKLAKSPPAPTGGAPPNPRYLQLRSFAFQRSLWRGYEHRMTKVSASMRVIYFAPKKLSKFVASAPSAASGELKVGFGSKSGTFTHACLSRYGLTRGQSVQSYYLAAPRHIEQEAMTTYQVPAHSNEIQVSFPIEHAMLLTFNRPKSLNAMTPTMGDDIDRVLTWFDNEPSLWVVIITGAGRVFCAGADLHAWNKRANSDKTAESELQDLRDNFNGFGSISRRSSSSKPMIAAVNGGAYGGGTEMLLNCDIVVAAEDAVIATPEVKRGVVAVAGVIPRLSRVAGHQLASEMLLTGRNLTAHEAATRWGFVNEVVPKDRLIHKALEWAQRIIENSPDAVQATKRALVLSKQIADVEEVVIRHTQSQEMLRQYGGDNIKIGLKAFAERRKPVWKNPVKL